MQADEVRLKCVKEAGKLRIKVLSKGYSHDANCQFPRDLRVEGREYLVPASDVKMTETRGKFFYRIGKKAIRVVESAPVDLSNLKIYGDIDVVECCICMCEGELIIMVPCGHRCSCKPCAQKVSTCPMCRAAIAQLITGADLQ